MKLWILLYLINDYLLKILFRNKYLRFRGLLKDGKKYLKCKKYDALFCYKAFIFIFVLLIHVLLFTLLTNRIKSYASFNNGIRSLYFKGSKNSDLKNKFKKYHKNWMNTIYAAVFKTLFLVEKCIFLYYFRLGYWRKVTMR